jgi:undecaprenyl-phosphate galactose phosphotransferase
MQPISLPSENADRLRKLKAHAETLKKFEEPIIPQHDALKRVFDALFSLLFMLVFSPLYFILALIVKATSPGPVFFKSRRLGRGGKIIVCLKYRTMYQDAELRLHELLKNNSSFRTEWNAFQKVKLDPRITPIGRFLRRTSLDEIPQFWNVLKGDLSVVGPRPPTLLGHPEQFLEEIRLLYGVRTAKILSVRPGITGLWQISGRSHISFEDRVKIEESYAENRTFWSDCKVILKTIPAVFSSRGAF